jgi:hypothetical protein
MIMDHHSGRGRRSGRHAFLVVVCLAFGGVLPSIQRTRVAAACVCLVDRDPAKQGAADLRGADAVFRGRVIKLATRSRPTWTCAADLGPPGQVPRGCLRVRVYEEACQEVKGVKVTVRTPQGREVGTPSYGDAAGRAEICGLAPGAYDVQGGAPGLSGSVERMILPADRGIGLMMNVAFASIHDVKVFIAVSESIKGGVPPVVEVNTWDHSASCGYDGFVSGGLYEVFARREKDGASLAVTLCGGTRRLDPPRHGE